VIMWAKIGTTVTNTIVSLGHVARRDELERAFAGATVHDFFNWMAVLIFFPIQLTTGALSNAALWMEEILEGAGGIRLFDPLKAVVRPASEGLSRLTGESGTMTLIIGIGLIIVALKLLVDVLRSGLGEAAEELIQRTLFRTSIVAIGVGAIATAVVQSSSVTTSVLVPMVGAGIITLEQMFPFTLGANIGTTITAMLAALATAEPAAIAVAFAHLLFNLAGTALIYGVPQLRAIPLRLARGLARLAARRRLLAFAYVAALFFGVPLALLALSGDLPRGAGPPDDADSAVVTPGEAPVPAPVSAPEIAELLSEETLPSETGSEIR